MAAFPYDLNTVLGGAARVLYAPTSTAVPVDPDDIFAQLSPYTARAGWTDFGATKESFTYNTGLEKSGYEIQQSAAAILEDVTSITRSVTVSVANITKETFAILENAPTPGSISAQGGVMRSYDEVTTGNFTNVTRYRVAFVARRHTGSGTVTESGTPRGRFVVGVGILAEISADERSLELAKGELAAVPITFTFFPDETQAGGKEFGRWWFETAGAI